MAEVRVGGRVQPVQNTTSEQRVLRLVRRLRSAQLNEGLTDEDMARRLGVSSSTLWMLYRGRRRPGAKLLRGMLRAFPELRAEVYAYLCHGVEGG